MHVTPSIRPFLLTASLLIVVAVLLACGSGRVAAESHDASRAARFDPGDWGAPVSIDLGGVAGLNTPALEGCPAEAPDGRALFFASNRDGQIDIWVSHRQSASAEWGTPEKLPDPVSVEGFNDFCPSPQSDGGLLFVSTRPGGCGTGTADIYRTRLHPTNGWLEPEHLGCEVNSAGNEFSPSHVEARGGMLFFSSDRDGGPGQDKIYVSLRRPDGSWGAPTEVVELNAPGASTARPFVSQDGRVILFDSNRAGGVGGPDIWASTRADPGEPWSEPVNLGPGINTEGPETRPWLSRDGTRLYLGSNRAGGEGDLDIYVSVRR